MRFGWIIVVGTGGRVAILTIEQDPFQPMARFSVLPGEQGTRCYDTIGSKGRRVFSILLGCRPVGDDGSKRARVGQTCEFLWRADKY